jgi:hypothetical protein
MTEQNITATETQTVEANPLWDSFEKEAISEPAFNQANVEAEIASPAIEEQKNHDVVTDANESDDEAEEPAKPTKRGKQKAVDLITRNALLEHENAQYKKFFDDFNDNNEQTNKAPAAITEEQVDAELLSYGLKPEDILDKQGVLAALRKSKNAEARVDQLEERQFVGNVQSMMVSGVAKNPDLGDALGFLANQKVTMAVATAQAMGDVNFSVEQAQQLALDKMQESIFNIAMGGKNPADVLYEIAKKAGYTEKSSLPKAGNNLDFAQVDKLRKSAGAASEVSNKAGGDYNLTEADTKTWGGYAKNY